MLRTRSALATRYTSFNSLTCNFHLSNCVTLFLLLLLLLLIIIIIVIVLSLFQYLAVNAYVDAEDNKNTNPNSKKSNNDDKDSRRRKGQRPSAYRVPPVFYPEDSDEGLFDIPTPDGPLPEDVPQGTNPGNFSKDQKEFMGDPFEAFRDIGTSSLSFFLLLLLSDDGCDDDGDEYTNLCLSIHIFLTFSFLLLLLPSLSLTIPLL